MELGCAARLSKPPPPPPRPSNSPNFLPSQSRKCNYTGQSVVSFFLLAKLKPQILFSLRFGYLKRAMPIRILTIGKKRSPGVQLLVDEYKEKVSRYCTIQDVLLRSNPKNTSDVKAQIEAEDMLTMQQIRPEDWVVVLDENGTDIVSEQLANLVGDAGKTGSSRLAFCVGGPYGLGPQVRQRADVTIRLSSMVLNHQIALVVLLEQLYRSWTIIKGQKYHH